MSRRSDERRAQLRKVLVAAARRRVRAGGLGAVRARDLAGDAGCAVGAIYNVFDDMTALLVEVNGETFRALGAAVADAHARAQGHDPREALIGMALAYLDFAADQANLWRALFDLELDEGRAVPDWYRGELDKLFAHIRGPLGALFADRSDDALAAMTQAVFASVHGIVLLGLDMRLTGQPRDKVAEMIRMVLRELGN